MYTNRTALFSRHQPGGVFTVADLVEHPNDIWFVHSGTGTNAAGYGRNPDKPVATLNYAVGLATASKGDVIYVMPGHAESYGTGAGFTINKAGLRIIGLGWGANRPTFTMTHADAASSITAASVQFENVRFVAGITAVKVGVQVTAVTDAVFRNCEWYWGDTTGRDFIVSLNMTAGSHRALVENCRFLAEPAVAGAASAVKLTGASHNVVVRNNEFMGDYSVACLEGITTLSQGLMFLNNLVHNTDADEPYLEVLTGTTGVIANTRGLARGATIAANAVADAMAHCENYVVNTAGTIAIIRGAGGAPALDADAA
jgi:hypothetical protein